MNVSLSGYNQSGGSVPLPQPVSLSWSAGLSGVSSSAVMQFRAAVPDETVRVAVSLDKTQLLDGFVDSIGYSIDKRGRFWQLRALSFCTRAAQNQVAPATYFGVSSAMLFSTYAAPYGIAENGLRTATMQQLNITPGMSAWNVIDLFCRQVYGQLPLVSRAGRLSTNDLSDTGIVLGEGGLPYTTLAYIDDRSRLVSQVRMQASDNETDFSVFLNNADAAGCGIKRVRFYRTPKSWETLEKRGAQEVLRNTGLGRRRYTILLPGYVDLFPGNVVQIQGLGINEIQYYVDSVRVNLDESGCRTVLQLYSISER